MLKQKNSGKLGKDFFMIQKTTFFKPKIRNSLKKGNCSTLSILRTIPFKMKFVIIHDKSERIADGVDCANGDNHVVIKENPHEKSS